jgi:chromosome segregation ATPase
LDKQTSIQAGLAAQEIDEVRQEHQQIKQEIAATSEDIQNQNKSQTRALGPLKTMVAEIKTMKQELRDDADTLTQLKISTREETAQINETMQEARQIQQALQEDVEDARHMQKTLQKNVECTVQVTIQKVADSQKWLRGKSNKRHTPKARKATCPPS